MYNTIKFYSQINNKNEINIFFNINFCWNFHFNLKNNSLKLNLIRIKIVQHVKFCTNLSKFSMDKAEALFKKLSLNKMYTNKYKKFLKNSKINLKNKSNTTFQTDVYKFLHILKSLARIKLIIYSDFKTVNKYVIYSQLNNRCF